MNAEKDLTSKDIGYVDLPDLTIPELQQAKGYYSDRIIKVSSLKRDNTQYDKSLKYAIQRYHSVLQELKARAKARNVPSR